jgi:hypothetical protein
LGFNFQNGSKSNYDAGGATTNLLILPTNMRIGGGYDFIFWMNIISIYKLRVNQTLVPTPPAFVDAIDADGNGEIDSTEQTAADNQYQSDLNAYQKN